MMPSVRLGRHVALVVLLLSTLSWITGDNTTFGVAKGTLSPAVSAAPRAPLDHLIDREQAVRFPLRPSLRAWALGPNGIVLGSRNSEVWVLGPAADRRIAIGPPPTQPWGYVAGASIAAWVEIRGDRFELSCADPTAGRPKPRPVSRTGVAAMDLPAHASADVLLWTDEAGAAHWIRGCDGAPRTLDVRDVLGLTYPEVYYAEPNRVRALNLETGQSSEVAVTALPEAFAANYVYAAWVNGDTLTVLDRRDGSRRLVRMPQAPEHGPAAAGRLTIGDRLVAYAWRRPESDLEYGFIYDVVNGTGIALPTAAFASRNRLLWREDRSYVVAPVPPA